MLNSNLLTFTTLLVCRLINMACWQMHFHRPTQSKNISAVKMLARNVVKWQGFPSSSQQRRGWPKYEERVSDTREQILAVLSEDSGIYTLHILINLVWKCPAAMWILHINQHNLNKSLHHWCLKRYDIPGLSQCFISSLENLPFHRWTRLLLLSVTCSTMEDKNTRKW